MVLQMKNTARMSVQFATHLPRSSRVLHRIEEDHPSASLSFSTASQRSERMHYNYLETGFYAKAWACALQAARPEMEGLVAWFKEEQMVRPCPDGMHL